MKRRRALQSLSGAVGWGTWGGLLGLTGCRPVTDASDPAWDTALNGLPGGFVGEDPTRAHAVLRDPGTVPAESPRGAGPDRRVSVLIAGGGVAGLAAARGLIEAGVDDFALLEFEDEAGGHSRAGVLGGMACPWGAHYLPVPGDDQPDLQRLLAEMGLLGRDAAGRWQPDERHLCHSPQERLWFNGQWQPGLLPLDGVGASTLAQYRQLADRVAQVRAQAVAEGQPFSVPFVGRRALMQSVGRASSAQSNRPMALVHQALDALFFDEWLLAQGFTDPHLRWYLDYVCRDEYGAGLNRVSAWAGVHYFAARHGFGLPGETEAGHAVFTWPQGNARLVEHLAAPLGSRLHTGWAVQRVTLDRQHVVVEALSPVTGERARWQARHAILALPAQVLLRVLPPAADPAVQAARRAADGTTHAAWVVTNLHLSQPLTDRGGAAPAWDNVAFAPDAVGRDPLTGHGLGYVNATHQALHRAPQAPTVHTHFRALGPGPAARHALMSRPWSHWVATEVAPWRDAHPDLASRITHATVARHGHGMVVPVPGLLHQRWSGSQLGAAAPSPHKGPTVHWAHSDASGISTFEEAFAQGLAAARQLQQPPSQRTRANPPQ